MLTCSALTVNVADRTLVRTLTFNLAAGDVIAVLGAEWRRQDPQSAHAGGTAPSR